MHPYVSWLKKQNLASSPSPPPLLPPFSPSICHDHTHTHTHTHTYIQAHKDADWDCLCWAACVLRLLVWVCRLTVARRAKKMEIVSDPGRFLYQIPQRFKETLNICFALSLRPCWIKESTKAMQFSFFKFYSYQGLCINCQSIYACSFIYKQSAVNRWENIMSVYVCSVCVCQDNLRHLLLKSSLWKYRMNWTDSKGRSSPFKLVTLFMYNDKSCI